MLENNRREKRQFVWRVAAAHVVAYFIAGILALLWMDYQQRFESEFMSLIMRPVDSPWVAAGAGLQLVRGLIIGLVLLPFREILLAHRGMVKLAALIFGLSYLSTIGPTFGSFEGMIYTKIPLLYHFFGIPETLVYTYLFTMLISQSYSRSNRLWDRALITAVVLIILMSLMGVFQSVGMIQR